MPGGNKGSSKKLTLAILGIDNAGKTVTAKGLIGESPDSVAPTIGFTNVEFKFNKQDVVLYDLGGGKKIRGVWKNYFSEVYGIVYVIDSSEPDRMEETRDVLGELLGNPQVAGKPVLLLGNKQDCTGALDEIDICESLGLEEIVNSNKCPCRVETCTAISGQGKKIDRAIHQGFEWLISVVNNNYEKLSERIEKDVAVQKEREAKEKEAKAERVRKIREERERERELRGEKDDSDEDTVDHGDPFKRLDVNQIKQQENLTKKMKKKPARLDGSRGGDSDPDISSYQSPRLSPRRVKSEDEDDSRYIPRQLAMKSTLTPRALPPIDPTARDEYRNNDSSDEEEQPRTYNSLSGTHWSNDRKSTPRNLSVLTHPSSRLTSSYSDSQIDSSRMLQHAPLAPLTPLAPLEQDTGKKKKKKAKKNQTVPATEREDEYDGSYTTPQSASELTTSTMARGWGTPPGQRSLFRASQSPRLSTLEEPDTGEEPLYSTSFNHRFGLEDGLPQLAQDTTQRRTLPNSEYDDGLMT